MIHLRKIVLIIVSALMLGVAGPVAILADDGNTEYLGSEPLSGYGDDGSTEYLGSEPLPPSGGSSCGDFQFKYPECDWGSQRVYEVYQDSCGNYDRRNYQTQPGQCGVPSQATPVSGDFTFRYPECDWDNQQVREVWQDSSGNYQYRNVHTEPGQCGATISQPPVPQPPAQHTVQNTVNQSQSQTNTQTQTVTVQQPPAQDGLSVRFATVDCPAGTIKKVKDSGIICEVTVQPRVEVAAAKTEVKELPKTGLPLLAWVAGAFLPAGLALKRFGKGISFDMEDHPQYLWEERQFKAGT